MRIPPRLRELVVCAAVGGAALLAAPLTESRAQESDPPAAAPTVTDEAELLRTRGQSGWRRYVWTLEREHLRRSLGDLVEARRYAGGDVTFAQVFLIAYAELVLGNEEAGERATAEVRRRAPTYPGLFLLDSFAATLRGDIDASIERLDRFVEIAEQNRGDPEFRFLGRLYRGSAYYEQAQHDEAIADLEAALAIAREAGRRPPSEAILRLALANQRVQQFGEAEKLVLGMLAEDPGNANLYYNMGLLHGTQNDFDEARRWYLAAVERRSDYADPHVKLAFLAWKDAVSDPAQLTVMRSHLDSYARLIATRNRPKLHADAQCGFGTYWFAVADERAAAGRDELAARAYARARTHFEAALRHTPTCVRALSNLVKIGFLMGLPDSEIAPWKERLDAIQSDDGEGPEAYRSTFC